MQHKMQHKTKKVPISRHFRAGDEGIEPPPKVLETPIIPLDQSPTNMKRMQILHLTYHTTFIRYYQ